MREYNVQSSNIQAVGYDPEAQTLTVRFASQATYRYAGVAPELAARFMFAESLGSFFAKNIRPHYSGEKVVDISESVAKAGAE